jgi:opacity protein-like surface antigen
MKKILFAMLAGMTMAATPALAADGTGFYVGAGIGQMGVDVGGFSGDDTGFKVFGGWMFLPVLGAELEYIDGGTAEDRGVEIDVSGFNASLRPAYSWDRFSVFGKLGMIFWDADFSLGGKGGSASDSGEDFSWGFGAGFDFTDNFGATLEYQGFEIEDTDTVDMISLGVVYKF